MSWRRFFHRDKWDRERAKELETYLEIETDENLANGSLPHNARYEAQRKLGNAIQIREEIYRMNSIGVLEVAWQDIRYGLRMLRKNPGLTAVAILTLAIGIGASTAVFSIVDTVLLKSLPYPEPDRIVLLVRQAAAGANLGFDEFQWGVREFHAMEATNGAFETPVAMKYDTNDQLVLTGAGEAIQVQGVPVSGGFFRTIGIDPILGRVFSEDEDRPGHEQVVVLGYNMWQNRFGGDPGILGRSVDLNGRAYTVIGVMPHGFVFPRDTDMPQSFDFPRETELWIPLALPPGPPPPNAPDLLAVIARLKPSITVAQAQAEMNVFAKTMDRDLPKAKGWFNSKVVTLPRQVTGDVRRPLELMLGAVGTVLLIACVNVANLLLAGSLGRRREFTLRAALGAERGRLVRQLLTESIILALLGGAGGVLLAEGGIRFARIFGPSSIPRLQEVHFDSRVFLFMLGVTFATGILFGLVPAFAATHADLAGELKEGGARTGSGPARQSIRSGLLVSEVAFAFVLVIAAGLLIQTFYRMLRVDPGFNASRVLTFNVTAPESKYKDATQIADLYHRALTRLQTVPGIQYAGLTNTAPMAGATNATGIRIEGRVFTNAKQRPIASFTTVSPDYFHAVGTPILRGRGFLESDIADTQQVVVISQAMARVFWPGEDPIGKRVGPGSTAYPLSTIVGIAADVKRLSLREAPSPEMYVPYLQKPWPSMQTMQMVLRTETDPSAMMASVREALHSVEQDMPIANESTLTTLVSNSMIQQQFTMLLIGVFGAVSLVLASVGIYGVISFNVSQRTNEIGIRMALGARPREILKMVLLQGGRLAAMGLAIGLAIAFAVTRTMQTLLYGVKPTDALTFVGVSILLMGVALLACYIPARRAAGVDPIRALRHE